jgi:hypothetical protein
MSYDAHETKTARCCEQVLWFVYNLPLAMAIDIFHAADKVTERRVISASSMTDGSVGTANGHLHHNRI